MTNSVTLFAASFSGGNNGLLFSSDKRYYTLWTLGWIFTQTPPPKWPILCRVGSYTLLTHSSWNFCRCAISPQHHSIQTIRRLNAAAGLAFCWCFVNINVILPVAEDAHVLLSPLVVVDSRRKAMSLSSSFCICGSTVHVRIIWCKCDWCLNCKLTENFNCRNLLTNLHRLRV